MLSETAGATPETARAASGKSAGSVRAPSIRARVRAEMTDEIKVIARRHLATDGANLSLRAVARDLGVVSSALYRYFPSRDELLTALIIDAYNALGSAVEEADASVADRADLRGRWLACCHAVRTWALADPAQYALVFGSPVVGYAAPEDTIAPASRTPVVLIGILADGVADGALASWGSAQAAERAPATGVDVQPSAADATAHVPTADATAQISTADATAQVPTADAAGQSMPAELLADLGRVRAAFYPSVPEDLLLRGTIGWIHLFGAISFELFGQLNNVIEARESYFDYQMHLMADLIGI